MNPYISGVETIIGHGFADPAKLWEALQAAGSPLRSICACPISDGQKRQTMIGDSVLKLALISRWYVRNDPHGAIQPVVYSVGSNTNLDTVGCQHELDRFIVTNPASQGAVSSGTMAATVEAILGAVYLDGGMAAVIQVMRTLGLSPV